jgi:hypothetical protein
MAVVSCKGWFHTGTTTLQQHRVRGVWAAQPAAESLSCSAGPADSALVSSQTMPGTCTCMVQGPVCFSALALRDECSLLGADDPHKHSRTCVQWPQVATVWEEGGGLAPAQVGYTVFLVLRHWVGWAYDCDADTSRPWAVQRALQVIIAMSFMHHFVCCNFAACFAYCSCGTVCCLLLQQSQHPVLLVVCSFLPYVWLSLAACGTWHGVRCHSQCDRGCAGVRVG